MVSAGSHTAIKCFSDRVPGFTRQSVFQVYLLSIEIQAQHAREMSVVQAAGLTGPDEAFTLMSTTTSSPRFQFSIRHRLVLLSLALTLSAPSLLQGHGDGFGHPHRRKLCSVTCGNVIGPGGPPCTSPVSAAASRYSGRRISPPSVERRVIRTSALSTPNSAAARPIDLHDPQAPNTPTLITRPPKPRTNSLRVRGAVAPERASKRPSLSASSSDLRPGATIGRGNPIWELVASAGSVKFHRKLLDLAD